MEWPARGGVVRLDDARARIERDGGALELALDGLELAYAPWEEDGAVIGSTVYLRAGDCVALRVRGLRAPSSRYGPPRTSDLELEMALDPCIDMLGALAAWRERRALRVGVGVDAQTRGDAREERRALAAERLRGAILERMAEGVNLVNPADGRILYTNRQFDEMFGYARGELFGQHVSILNAPTELTPVGRSAAIIKAVRRGNRWRGEVLNQRKDGAVFWCFAVVSEIEDAEHGRVWITLQMDITAQKQAEEQLSHAGRLSALGTLGAGIAHEFNQPLGAITLLAEHMQASPKERVESCRVQLELILQQTRRMARVVDNIRVFTSKRPLLLTRCDALQSLEDALLLMRAPLRRAGIEVARELEPSLPEIVADRVQLQQVFMNLLDNSRRALQSAPAGQALTITVRGRARGRWLEYQVEDNGPGVPFAITPRIFEPFFSTREAGAGMGLGLSLAFGIVRSHEGEIEYEPAAGGGARFIVRIPVASAESLADADERAPVGDVVVVASASGARVSALVEDVGWRPHAAATAREAVAALERLGRARGVATLVDLRAPELDGVALCRELGAAAPEVPLIVLAGRLDEDAARRLHALGVAAIVREPIVHEQLRKTLEACS